MMPNAGKSNLLRNFARDIEKFRNPEKALNAPGCTREKCNVARRAILITERQFEAQVREIATWTGWMIYHTYNSVHSPAGFPDLVMARAPRLIFAELKSAGGRLRDEQTHWLDELGGVAGIETYVWRPADIDEITRILSKR